MSVHVVSAVWRLSEARGVDRLTLVRLADQASDAGWCWPSLETLAEECLVSQSTVQRALRTLEAAGELTVCRRGRRQTNVYRVLVGTPEEAPWPSGLDAPTPKVTGQPDQSPEQGEWSNPAQVSGHSYDTRIIRESPEEGEPSKQGSPAPPTQTAPAVRPRDLLFEAVAEACGWDLAELTAQARGWVNSALPELRRLHATPDQVHWKARVYRANDPAGKRPTPSALVKHWPALTAASLERVDRRQLDRELAQQQSEQQLRQTLEG